MIAFFTRYFLGVEDLRLPKPDKNQSLTLEPVLHLA
jgi:hypothetical protein